MIKLNKGQRQVVKEHLKDRRKSTLTGLRNLFAPGTTRGKALHSVAKKCGVSTTVLRNTQSGLAHMTPAAIEAIRASLETLRTEQPENELIGPAIQQIDLNTLLAPTQEEISSWMTSVSDDGSARGTTSTRGVLAPISSMRGQAGLPGEMPEGGVCVHLGRHVRMMVTPGAKLSISTRSDGGMVIEIPPANSA